MLKRPFHVGKKDKSNEFKVTQTHILYIIKYSFVDPPYRAYCVHYRVSISRYLKMVSNHRYRSGKIVINVLLTFDCCTFLCIFVHFRSFLYISVHPHPSFFHLYVPICLCLSIRLFLILYKMELN